MHHRHPRSNPAPLTPAMFAALLLLPTIGAFGCGSDADGDAGKSEPGPAYAFPKGFLWGTSTAGFQVDMGCPTMAAEQCEDRASDWYQFVADPDLAKDKTLHLSGDPVSVGPGMWELYDADFARAKDELHSGAIRLSLEWSRLFPDAAADAATTVEALDAVVDKAARDHYRAMFKAARDRGLQLLVTLNHYTLPLWLHDGKACNKNLETCKDKGWVDHDRILSRIALYSAWCARTYGDQVDFWATINEPFAVVLSGYLLPSADRTNPPAVVFEWKKGVEVAFTMMEAHAKMYDAVHAEDNTDVDGDGAAAMVGLVPNLVAMRPSNPENPDDLVAAEHLAHVYNRVFLEATVLGKLDRDLDGVFEETRDDMKGRMDYIGVNYYTRIYAQKKPIPGASALFPYLDSSPDLGAGVWLDDPAGMGEMVTWAAKTYGLPVIITENGTSRDKATAWEDYVRPHLIALHEAMQDPEVRVLGYFYWSLLDNYEWNHGMAMRFGLYGVDTDNPAKPRTLTTLGERYGEAARRNGFD